MSGVRAFVSLTYDDALPCHHESVAPLLETYGLRGTFYTPISPRMLGAVDAWKKVAAAGHELGNHTVFHPCSGARAWLDEAYSLDRYTERRWRDEIALANAVLQTIDGRSDRSFGNTCHQNVVGPAEAGLTVEGLGRDYFVGIRGEHTGRKVDLAQPNWFNLGTLGIDGKAFDEVLPVLEDVAKGGGWMIFTLHGVGPRDHRLNMEEEEHRKLVEWLFAHRDEVTTAPVRDIAKRLRGLE
jgi:Predicted xylanase/chitin deacetylase